MAWDPVQYLGFAGERLRPAIDLLARVPLERPGLIYDLGCGTGTSTRILAERWPEARIVGLDSSPEMLETARKDTGSERVGYAQADIGGWQAAEKADLVFSNAALHWLDHHDRLMPQVAAQVRPGGWVAIQMPNNHRAASHMSMGKAALQPRFEAKLAHLVAPDGRPVPHLPGGPDYYYRHFAPLCARIEIWETEYLQVLSGDNPVVAFTSGSGLRPFLDALAPGEREDFLADYSRLILEAYPPQPDGKTLFPFRRIFILGQAR